MVVSCNFQFEVLQQHFDVFGMFSDGLLSDLKKNKNVFATQIGLNKLKELPLILASASGALEILLER